MRRGWGILLAAVLGISAVHYGGTDRNTIENQAEVGHVTRGATGGSSAAANSSTQPSAECSFHDELLDTVRQFYKLSDNELPDFPSFPSLAALPSFTSPKPQFLIATVPDPVHTHLGLFFDRNIEAIEEAAQTQGYIFDRQILPWDNKSHPEATDFRIRDKEKACAGEQEKYPGLLIFRPSIKDDNPLFIFVVGEKPTGGINYTQFHNALEIIHDFQPVNTDLRIMGPTFSGSLYSLNAILRKKGEPLPVNIYIHSGTVMSWAAAKQFLQEWCENPDNRNVQFVTFQESDQYRLRHFLHYYIEKNGYLPQEVAQLSEGETAFGRFPEKTDKPPSTNKSDSNSKGEKDEKDEKSKTNECEVETKPFEAESCVLHLYFPREISQLRSAYQRDVYVDQGSANSGKPSPRVTLKLDFDNVGNEGDSIPSYSGKQMPLSQESILLGIVTSLKKHHSRFVLLRATDPLDELFLSRFLRQAYPDGRVITTGADLLFNRQEDTLLHGVWSMSTYPLLTDIHKQLPEFDGSDSSGASHIDPKFHVDRNFPFAYGVGVYNATLSLLTNNGQLKFKHQTCQSKPYLPQAAYEQYGWPALGGKAEGKRLRTPPLWLSVMGRDGYWPMALLDEANPKEESDPPSRLYPADGSVKPAKFKPGSPASWSFLCGFCLLLALIHLLLVWSGSSMSRSEAFAQFAPHKNWRRVDLLFLAGLSIVAVLEILINLDTSVLRRSVMATVTLIFILAFLLDLVRRSRPIPQTPVKPSHIRLHVITVIVITGIMLAWGFFARVNVGSWRIFLYRSIHIASAVSPVVPILLLLAGAYWCVWHSLSGASLLDRRRPRLPEARRVTVAASSAAATSTEAEGKRPRDIAHCLREEFRPISFGDMQDLRNVAKPFAWDSRIVIPLAIVGSVAALMMFGFKHPVESLEGPVYDWAYAALLCLITGLLLSNLFRLLTIWLECRRLLVALDRLPLRRAFRKLHGFSWKPIWRPGGSAFRDTYRLIAREMESLAHLKKTLKEHLMTPDTIHLLPDPEDRRRQAERHRLVNAISELQENEHKQLMQQYRIKDESPFVWKTLLHRQGWNTLINSEPVDTASLVETFKSLQVKLANVCGMALNFLQTKWTEEDQPVANRSRKSRASRDVELAEEYIALVYSSFILNILLRIRTIIMCVTGMFIFILLSVNSYPFQPQSSFRVLVVGLFVLIGGIVGSVYAQMHRDPTLSLLTDTKPGELGRDFWIKLAGFGIVPLLGLVASQFPEVNRFLFSWLQPALEALK